MDALDAVLAALAQAQHGAPLTPSLVHYVFFPVSQLLTASERGIHALTDRVKGRVFAVLTALARDWWRAWTAAAVGPLAPGASLATVPQWRVWEQLLLLAAMALGAGLTAASDATRVHMATFAAELLAPRFASAAPASGEWEWDGVSELPDLDMDDDASSAALAAQVYPAAPHVHAARSVPAVVGALTHLVKLALDVSVGTAQVPLRVPLVRVAEHASATWLAGDVAAASFAGDDAAGAFARWHASAASAARDAVAQRLTPILPGMASALLKIALGRGADGAACALRVLAKLLVMCIGDSVTHALRAADAPPAPRVPARLEDIVRAVHVAPDGELTRAESDSESLADSVASEATASTAATSASASASVVEAAVRDVQWLRRTMRMVMITLNALEPLSASESAAVLVALADCADALLAGAAHTLDWAWELFAPDVASPRQPTRTLMRVLLDARTDHHADRVSARADLALAVHAPRRLDLVDSALGDALSALPRAIRRVHDAAVVSLAARVASAADVLSGAAAHAQLAHRTRGILRMLGPAGGVSTWGDAIDAALRPDGRIPQWTADLHLRPSFAALEPRAVDALGRMWNACGAAVVRLVAAAAHAHVGAVPTGFRSVFYAPLHLLEAGAAARTTHTATLYAADELLRGAARLVSEPRAAAFIESRAGAPARRLALECGRSAAEVVLGVWEHDLEDEHPPLAVGRARAADAPEVRTGLVEAPRDATHLDYVNSASLANAGDAPAAAAHARAVQRRDAALRVGDMQLLSVLASAAELMGTAFRTLLLRALYVCVSALGSGDVLLCEAAQLALERIAAACAYPSVASCVLHNADYVLGTASHLLVSGLGHELYGAVTRESAPRVLLSARAAPWVLVQVIRLLGVQVLPLVEDALDEVLDALDMYHGYPEVSLGLLQVLAHIMRAVAGDVPEKRLEHARAPDAVAEFAAWLSSGAAEAPDAGADADPNPNPDPDPDPNPDGAGAHTRAIIVQILERAVPFLSHESPRLRTTALDMIRDGVHILGAEQRYTDLYPVLHRAWPLLMARLGAGVSARLPPLRAALPDEQDANVWMHAAACIGAIGLHASDVFGRPIVEQAWPRFQRILAALDEPRPAPGVRILVPHATPALVVQHIADALAAVVAALGTHTDSRALWDMAAHPQLLDTLDTRQPRAVHAAGERLWHALERADACAAWLVLRSAQTGHPLAFLERPALQSSLYITEL